MTLSFTIAIDLANLLAHMFYKTKWWKLYDII